MIPIRDTLTSRSFPVVTFSIMAVNTLVFLFQLGLGPGEAQFLYLHGLVPAKLTVPEVAVWFSAENMIFSFISYMFLHGGFWHFIGNMWFLYLFGDNVEDHLGSVRYLGFYFVCGIASAGLHFVLNPVSNVPTIGASGAIAGVMGAYFILYPGAKILTLIPIIIIPWIVEIPAFIFLGFWFLMQFFNATGSGAGSGIAWWAHVGGFVAGMILVKLSPKVPELGAGKTIKKVTAKKRTPKLQAINAMPLDMTSDLMGEIEISSLEALKGSRKIVNIPWGFYKRLYRVTIPSGVTMDTKLRLQGMGSIKPDGTRGDMYLKIVINNGF